MRLASGVLGPMPITLDVTEEFAKKLTPGSKVALRDAEGVMLAVLHVEEVWQADRAAEAKAVFNSTSKAHPGAEVRLASPRPCPSTYFIALIIVVLLGRWAIRHRRCV